MYFLTCWYCMSTCGDGRGVYVCGEEVRMGVVGGGGLARGGCMKSNWWIASSLQK